MRRTLTLVALLATAALPNRAHAQRAADAIATPRALHSAAHAAAPDGRRPTAPMLTASHDTTEEGVPVSNVAAWGALGGAMLGGALGYGLGLDCTASASVSCRRTPIIGGALVGAVIGYGLGSIVDMGIMHDRRRAHATGKD